MLMQLHKTITTTVVLSAKSGAILQMLRQLAITSTLMHSFIKEHAVVFLHQINSLNPHSTYILEYEYLVWHPGLIQQLSEDILAIQKRCLRIIYSAISYAEALVISGLKRLDERHERFTRNMFEEMKMTIVHRLPSYHI
jgi:hypothetical protein